MALTRISPIGDLLKRFRLSAGLTQEQLAERAGLSVRGLSDIERGLKSRPHHDTLALLANALGLARGERTLLEQVARGTTTSSAQLHGNTSTTTSRHNLPAQLSSFVGREGEIEEIRDRLAAARLLTLTGAGGCGKTRLALEVAALILAEYPDGVWLAELAPVSDPRLVPSVVATVLGLREEPGQPILDTLLAALRTRRVLLVLDNCEHLVDACARLVEDLLRRCSEVRILATSREALRVPGEVAWRVPSLPFPDPENHQSRETVARSDSVRLFVERAAMTRPDFELTERNSAPIAQICRQLDGMPLAIELAAGRMMSLSPEQIAGRLDQRFRLLSGGSRTALPRQQTLRATVDWSYDLLSEAERALFRRLSVFAGGWTLEAAEAVCVESDVSSDDVLGLLLQLVDKSLVQTDETADGWTRYRLLETLRQYGLERLAATSDGRAVEERHTAYYLALTEDGYEGVKGVDQLEWIARLEADVDNIRSVLRRTLAPDASDAEKARGLRVASAMWWPWYIRNNWSETRDWLVAALAVATDSDPAVRAAALGKAALVSFLLGDVERCLALEEQGLRLARSTGDSEAEAMARAPVMVRQMYQGRLDEADKATEEVLALSYGRHPWYEASALAVLGSVRVRQGRLDEAVRILDQSAEQCRAIGERLWAGYALCFLGLAEMGRGNVEQAESCLTESVRVLAELGNVATLVLSQISLGQLALRQGNTAKAAEVFRASLDMARRVGRREVIASSLAGLGMVCAVGQPRRATKLHAAAQAIRASLGVQTPSTEAAAIEREVTSLRAALGDAGFQKEWAAGQAMPLDQVVAYAMGSETRDVDPV
jgi:predicted ATPase/DNA-binding XRE family transcriptional regulator